MCLPQMHHLVAEGLKQLHQGVMREVFRVDRQFVDIAMFRLMVPALERDIPHQAFLSLKGDQTRRKRAIKQHFIEVLEGGLKELVGI